MKPTLDNLDQWLFDSVEGNLSPEQQILLDQFFEQNPELGLEQEAWHNATYAAAPLTFEPKAALYRKQNFNKYYAAAAALLLFVMGAGYLSIQQTQEVAGKAKGPKFKQLQAIENRASHKTLANSKPIYTLQSEANAFSQTLAQNTPTLLPFANLFSDKPVQALPLDLNQLPLRFPNLLNGYRTDLRFEALAGIETALDNNKSYRWPALQRINQFAQKELGLSNNQSYDLLLPGKNNIDANISSVGSKSQTRFQYMSLLRSGVQNEQALLGQQVSLDGYARSLKTGLGMQVNYLQYAGAALTDYEIGFIAAPKLMLSKQVIIEPAARLRMGMRQVNPNRLGQLSFIEFQNADLREVNIDSTEGIGRRLPYRDLDLSLAIQTPILFASVQLENVFQHFDYAMGNELNPQNSRAPQQLTCALGTQYASRNERMRLAPYLLFTSNRLQTQFHAGVQLNINKWQFGLNVANNQQYQAALGYFGRHLAIFAQSCQQQLLSLDTPSYLHQLTFRIYSQNSRQARRYISL